MMKTLLIAPLLLCLVACAGAPQRGAEATRPSRIIEEDITSESPSRSNIPQQGAPDASVAPPPTIQDSQENTLPQTSPGQRPPRRIIWRDQGAPER
ncbi:MAG: hypothetical protein ACPL7J_15445, partial [Desulfomonilaceae bacterium]